MSHINDDAYRCVAVKNVVVRLGKSAVKSLASSVTASAIFASGLVSGLSEATQQVAAAEVSAIHQIALSIPFKKEQHKTLLAIIEAQMKSNPSSWVDSLKNASVASQIRTIGFEASIIPALASFAVNELFISTALLAGGDKHELLKLSVSAALAAGGSVGGSVVGAAVGSVLLPGAGPVLGSLIGNQCGAVVAARWVKPNEECTFDNSNPSRSLKVVEIEDGFLLVEPESTEVHLEREFESCSPLFDDVEEVELVLELIDEDVA